jgi:hypothetical protein
MKKTGLMLPGLLALMLAGPVSLAAGQPAQPAPYPPGYPPGTGAPPPSYPGPPSPPAPPPAPTPVPVQPQPPSLPPAQPPPAPAVVVPEKPAAAAADVERHQGLFLRLVLGYGYANAESDLSIEGGGHPKVQLAMGYAIVENLALFAQLKLSAFAAAGVGATYYLMPVNLFAGAAISAGTLQARSDRVGSEYKASAAGPVVSLFLGKEWWVSEDWGLGLAFDADWGKVNWKDDFDQGHDITAYTIGAALVATFN